MSEADKESQFVTELTDLQQALRLYVQSLMPGDSSAKDVAQLANSTIWRKRSDFELGTNFKAWAFTIARYEVLNYRKQQARDSRLTFSSELEDIVSTEVAEIETDEQIGRQAALKECLARLKPGDQALLMHRYRSTGTLMEFAEKNNRSLGGLKVTLHRLRKELFQCIKGKMVVKEVRV